MTADQPAVAVIFTIRSENFAALQSAPELEGIRKTPLRANHHLAPPKDMYRVWRADRGYHTGFHNLYRDYPRELWD